MRERITRFTGGGSRARRPRRLWPTLPSTLQVRRCEMATLSQPPCYPASSHVFCWALTKLHHCHQKSPISSSFIKLINFMSAHPFHQFHIFVHSASIPTTHLQPPSPSKRLAPPPPRALHPYTPPAWRPSSFPPKPSTAPPDWLTHPPAPATASRPSRPVHPSRVLQPGSRASKTSRSPPQSFQPPPRPSDLPPAFS